MTPLLVCSVGPYAIRGRPLAIGIPLDHVAAVRPLERLMPLPGQDSGLLGFALHDGQIISVLSPTHLLGLPEADEDAELGERSAARHLVVLNGNAGLVGLVVTSATGIERPLHWAGAGVLAPITCGALAGAVLRPERWIAVLDPARLSAAPATPAQPAIWQPTAS